MGCDGKGGPEMDNVRYTATSAAEQRLKVSLLDRKKKNIKGGERDGVTPGVGKISENTTIPARRNLQRIMDQHKGIGI